MKAAPTTIDDALRKRVQLEKLYPFEMVVGLTDDNGDECTGLFFYETKEIKIRAGQTKKRTVATYLHEVGHLIAAKNSLSTTPKANIHNQYFAVLVAIMYRRCDLLPSLKYYDFADGANRQRADSDEPELDDAEILERFEYIIRRSSDLAPKNLSIEQIAKILFDEDALPEWKNISKPIKEIIVVPRYELYIASALSLMMGLTVGVSIFILKSF